MSFVMCTVMCRTRKS